MGPTRVVIAGGGTGGHLFPGVALAEELSRLEGDVEVSFVGTDKGIEARVVPGLGYELNTVDVVGLKGSGALGLLKGALKLPGAGLGAASLVRKLDPDLVVSVGGYAAGPFTMVAAAMGVPTALLEQNTVPGVTNRTLGRAVRRAFLTYASSESYFTGATCETLGNPIRRELIDRASSYSYAPPAPGEPLRVLVLGGSGGSLSLNRGVPAALCELGELGASVHVTHQVGKQRGEEVAGAYEGFTGEVEVVTFIDDMASAYSDAHLLICRAGATTIAEVLAFGLPAIYVPFPGAADNHQERNALEIVDGGGGLMVGDDEVTSGRLTKLVQGLAENPQSLANMAAAARGMGRPDAGERIAQACLELAR